MARLNLFQKTMLLWDDMLPYNAVHAFRVDLAPDLERLKEEIRFGLEGCGYPCERDEVVLREYEPASSPEETIAEVSHLELNERFDRGESSIPFRFFVIASEEEGFCFGVCYFHLVAGGDSICWLLEGIMARYAGRPKGDTVAWSGLEAPAYRTLLLRHLPYFWRWLRSVPADLRRSRRFARLPGGGGPGGGMGVLTHPLSEQQWNWIREQKAQGEATINDVLLCLALVAAAADQPEKKKETRRKKIAIGGIANTRGHFGEKHARTFGLFVAFTSVAQAVPKKFRFRELLAKVHDETETTKRDRLYLRDLVKLGGSLLWMKFHSIEERRGFYRKFFPLSAGVTSFHVDRFQTHLTGLPVKDYWRAVSASPANPLVVACTTMGKRANIALAYDRSVYTDERAGSFLGRVVDTMNSKTEDE